MAFAKKGTVAPLKQVVCELGIVGEVPLMENKFSAKSAWQMLAKQMKLASTGRERREPVVDLIRGLHLSPDRQHFGFPAKGLKAVMVRGCLDTNTMPMTQANTAFHVVAEFGVPPDGLIAIYGTPEFTMAAVTNDGGGRDLRFRPCFNEWASKFRVRFNASRISHEQLVQVLVAGGFGIGLGEDRYEKGGSLGGFRHAPLEEVEDIRRRHEAGREEFLARFREVITRVDAEGSELWQALLAMGADLTGLDKELPDVFKKLAKPKKNGKTASAAAEVEE